MITKKIIFNANFRKSNADKRRFICENPRYICENLRLRRVFQTFLFISLTVLILGCYSEVSTYKQKEIAESIKKLCLNEYGIKVSVRQTANTVWVYYPISKILSSNFDKVDEDFANKLRNVMTNIGRVLLSVDKPPDFYMLVASDIKNGFDYSFTVYVRDLKKLYAEALPLPEFNKRRLINFNADKGALGDTTGEHLKIGDIDLAEFLTQQIEQRINYTAFELFKTKLKSIKGNFYDGVFRFEYETDEALSSRINFMDECLKIISLVLRDYNFRDFLVVEIENKTTGQLRTIGRHALFAQY